MNILRFVDDTTVSTSSDGSHLYNLTNTDLAKLNDMFNAKKNKVYYVRPNLIHPDIHNINT